MTYLSWVFHNPEYYFHLEIALFEYLIWKAQTNNIATDQIPPITQKTSVIKSCFCFLGNGCGNTIFHPFEDYLYTPQTERSL